MNGQASSQRWVVDRPIPYKWAAVISYALVVLVFLGDWFTPVSVVIGVAYEAPVVFAALQGTRRLTILTVLLGSIGIVLGWLVDWVQASYQFNDVRIENRLLSIVSIWIVGALAILVQQNAERTARLESEQNLRREASLSLAVDRVMSALSPGRTVQAIAGEAPAMLDAEAAVWCSTQADGPFWLTMNGSSEAKMLDVHPTASFSALLRRLSAQRSVEVVSAADSIDYLVGRPLGHEQALAIPVGDETNVVGIVFAAVLAPKIDDRALVTAGNFARFASTAVKQAHFAEELAHHHN
jgi:hypothetical protein